MKNKYLITAFLLILVVGTSVILIKPDKKSDLPENLPEELKEFYETAKPNGMTAVEINNDRISRGMTREQYAEAMLR